VLRTLGAPGFGRRQVLLTYSMKMMVEPSGVVTVPPYCENLLGEKPSLAAFDGIRKMTL